MDGPGRPLKFETPEALEEAVDEYFEMCDNSIRRADDGKVLYFKPYTMSGLAIALGTNRQTIINYSHREEYFDTIKKARARVENYAEEELFSNPRVAGVIFNLKNNHGWKDKQEIEQTGNTTLSIEVVDAKDSTEA